MGMGGSQFIGLKSQGLMLSASRCTLIRELGGGGEGKRRYSYSIVNSSSPQSSSLIQVGMDELENQTIQEWRASERKVANVKITLLQIDPMQR